MDDITQKILKGVRVDLTEAYQMNFRRKAFFSGAPWKPTKHPVLRGSLLQRSGALYNEVRQSKIEGDSIVFRFGVPYAQIHNEGGKAGRNQSATIPKRQFIGHAPEVDRIMKENIDDVLPGSVNEFITKLFNNNG